MQIHRSTTPGLISSPGQRTGTLACHYSPYGVSAPANPGSLGYTGQLRDPVTSAYLLGNGYRSYSPGLMRFQSPDSLSPFGKGGINAYGYCAGDPINRIDPNGHFYGVAGLVLRGLGMLSSALTIAYNFLGPLPTTRISLNASRVSTMGSLISLGSSAAQYAGVESAIFGSNLGLTMSAAGTATRAINAAFGSGSQPLKRLKDNWNLMTGGPHPVTVDSLADSLKDVVIRDRQQQRIESQVIFDVNKNAQATGMKIRVSVETGLPLLRNRRSQSAD